MSVSDLQIVLQVRPMPGGEAEVLPDRTDPDAQARSARDYRRVVDEARSFPAGREEPVQDVCPGSLAPHRMEALALARAAEMSVEADRRRFHVATGPSRGDFEHSHEDARRALGAMETGAPSYAIVRMGDTPETSSVLALGGSERPLDPRAPTVWLGVGGPPPWLEDARPDERQLSLARRYWELEAFHAAAGRAVVHVPTLQHVPHVLRRMARWGHARAFLKAARLKLGTWSVFLSPSARGLEGAWEELLDNVDARILRLPDDGPESGWLVQEWCPVVDETRIFVVDGRIAAAVPVRRLDTVYDAIREPGCRVDPRSCLRPAGEDSRPDRAGPARRVRFARGVVRDIRAEKPELRDYVLDVAEREDGGGCVAVELNPLSNAGLYSCDPGIVAAALVAAWRRGPAVRPVRAQAASRMTYEVALSVPAARDGRPQP